MSYLQDFIYWATIKPRLKKLQRLLPEAKIYPAGSRYVCNPPRFFTDVDFVVYSEHAVEDILYTNKYKKSSWSDYRGVHLTYGAEGEFTAWRRGRINLIVALTWNYAERFNVATHICRSRNIREKWQRIVVHEALRGNWLRNRAGTPGLPPDLFDFLESLQGPYGNSIYQAYRAQHDLLEM